MKKLDRKEKIIMTYEIEAISKELEELKKHSDTTTVGELADGFKAIIGLCLDALKDLAPVNYEEKEHDPNEPEVCVMLANEGCTYTYKDPVRGIELQRGPFDNMMELHDDLDKLTDSIESRSEDGGGPIDYQIGEVTFAEDDALSEPKEKRPLAEKLRKEAGEKGVTLSEEVYETVRVLEGLKTEIAGEWLRDAYLDVDADGEAKVMLSMVSFVDEEWDTVRDLELNIKDPK